MDREFTWDYKGWSKLTPDESDHTQTDWNETLITMINMANNEIYKTTGQNATEMVMSQKVASVLTNTMGYDMFLKEKYEVNVILLKYDKIVVCNDIDGQEDSVVYIHILNI